MAAMIQLRVFGGTDLRSSDGQFRRAIALEPNNAFAHGSDAMLLATLHKGELALAAIDRPNR